MNGKPLLQFYEFVLLSLDVVFVIVILMNSGTTERPFQVTPIKQECIHNRMFIPSAEER